jgi:tetratricopeptide (TPR) repeat protein
MESLDLNAHDPEEYEGKVVIRKRTEYVVGAYLGSGAERITHKLINRASGLCLHVLKIWRRSDLGYVPSQIRAKLAAGGTSHFDFAKIVPVSIEIELPGGRAEMQVYAGGSNDESTRADKLTEKGDGLLDNSQPQEAIAAYEEALAENPHHTHALVNMAAAHARLDDLAGAYHAAAQAANIEPNYPLYRRALIEYLAAQGLARLALDEFRAARENFPNLFDFDDLGAELFLICGEPESALACAEECLLDSADKDRLITKVRVAVEAKSRARDLLNEARSLVQHADPPRVVAALERARAIDQYDPLLITNLAFNLARAGRCHEAIPLLFHAATHGPLHWSKVCYANAAFCAMEDGDLQSAMILLGSAMSQIDAELQGSQMEDLTADLPGKGIWVDEQSIVEERLDSAARLVVLSVRAYEKESTMPEEAASLARLYGKVANL